MTGIVNQRYTLLRRLGQGGMGEVFLASDREQPERLVALKYLTRDRDEGEALREEFRKMSRLSHPHLVKVFDLETDRERGAPFIVMEYVEGRDFLAACRAAPLQGVVELTIQACRGLGYLHSQGIIHRDLKPENLIVSLPAGPDGAPLLRILDLGLAHHAAPETQTEKAAHAAGTLPYAAPEQFRGEWIDHRADLYSLGVLLYQALCSRLPFDSTDPVALIQAHLSEEPAPPTRLRPDLDPAVEAIVLRLLRKRPAERYQSASQIEEALLRLSAGPGAVAAAAAPRRAPRLVGRERLLGRITRLISTLVAAEAPRDTPRLLLRGDAGSGKSRLAEETRTLARSRGVEVALVDGAEGGQAPFGLLLRVEAVLHDLRRRVSPSPDVPVESEGATVAGSEAPTAPARALWKVARQTCEACPTLLLLENLHAADRDSLRALATFLNDEPPGRLLLLATSREPLEKIDPDLARAWRGAAEPQDAVEELQPLSEDEISLLLASFAGADPAARPPELVLARAAGSPLFAIEWARALLERGALEIRDGRWMVQGHDPDALQAPAGLVELERLRLRAFSPSAGALVTALTVLDRPAGIAELAAVTALGESEVQEAARELARDGHLEPAGSPGGPLALAHAALGEAALSLSGSVLAAFHARAAAWLERQGAAPAAELAAHWRQAGDPARTFPLAVKAAEEAGAAGAREQQLKMLSWAIESTSPGQARERIGLLLHLGWAHIEGHSWEHGKAERLFSAAEEEARAQPGAGLLAEALIGRHLTFMWDGKIGSSRLLEPEIQDLLSRHPNPRLQARFARNLSILSTREGDVDQAAAHARRAADLYLSSGALIESALCLNNAGLVQTRERHPDLCEPLLRESESLLIRAGERDRLFFPRFNLAMVSMCRGKWEEAEQGLLGVMEHVRSTGFTSWIPVTRLDLGFARQSGGAPDVAIADYEAAAREARRTGLREVELYAQEMLGSLLRLLGLRERARQVHEEALATARSAGLELQIAFLGAALAEDLCELEPEAPRAAALAAEASARAERLGKRRARVRGLVAQARARLAAGNPDEADRLLAQARDLTDPAHQHLERAPIEITAARTALARGDRPAAAAAIGRGLEHASRGNLRAAEAELLALRIEHALSEDADPDLRLLTEALDALTARVSDPAIARLARFAPAWKQAAERAAEQAAARATQPALADSAGAAAAHEGEPRLSERRVLQALAELGRDLESLEDPRRVAAALVERARALVEAERALLVLTDANGENARAAASSGLPPDAEPEALQFSRAALARGLEAPLLVVNTALDPLLSSSLSVAQFGIRSVICVPLRLRGTLLGALYLDSRGRLLEAGADHLRFIEAFAHQAAAALDATRALDSLRAERERLCGRARERYRFHSLLGRSPVMQAVYDLLDPFSKSDLPVLITGESGTGKELVARALHWNSARRDAPFVAESCAAIPQNLLESEMFGHLRGAFTGAERDRRGMFVEASGGTLFLDEIGEMGVALQAKLLRALQEKQIRPLGGGRAIPVDVRIVAATHRDLAALTRSGAFREDLLFRIRVLTLHLPPIRERLEDLPLLARHFLSEHRREQGRGPTDLSSQVLARLSRHTWPGNVRELRSEVLKLAMVADGERVEERDLEGHAELFASILRPGRSAVRPQAGTLRDLERREVERALRAAAGDKLKAARLLGLSRATLYRKLRRYRIPHLTVT